MKDIVNEHLAELLASEKERCHENVLRHQAPTDGLYCAAEFDGWSCLNHTKAGTTAFVQCPPLPMFNTSEVAHRYCTENGTWHINEKSGVPWTNHSLCVRHVTTEDVDPRTYTFLSAPYLFVAGSALSLIFLIISLAIFFGFRQLRCDRVVIHQNLFISFALTAVSWSSYYLLVVMDTHVQLANPVWCRVLHLFSQYFTTCNFSWMFCESIYLHMIMAHALRTGKKLLKCIIIAGWGAPIIPSVIYAGLRSVSEDGYKECWVMDDVLQWILAAPVLLSIVLIVIILINLVRLLVTKLKQIADAHQNRKAAKAILILVPLFGLQHLLFPVRPAKDTYFADIYLHVTAFLMGTQGTLLSIVFCFCNGEVKSLLRRKWHQHRLMTGHARKNTGLTSSSFVDPDSVMDTSRDVTNQKSKIYHDTKATVTETQELKLLSPGIPNVSGSDDEDAPNEKSRLQNP